jgi:hypothetical protein
LKIRIKTKTRTRTKNYNYNYDLPIIMAIDEVVTLILLLQNLQGIWCDNILILSKLIRQMKPLSQQHP